MSPDVVLRFEGGYVRPLLVSDIHDGYVDGLNSPNVNKYLDGVKHMHQTHQSVLDFVVANNQSISSVLWGIWVEGSEKFCGTVRLHGIELKHFTAHIGICLFDQSVWGKGLGKKAISIVTKWALNDLNLRWVEAGAYQENIASQRAFLSAGYSWKFDIDGKYILEGKPALVKVFAAQSSLSI
jgi:RimJ/RimL family protein N-acetyltransferase